MFNIHAFIFFISNNLSWGWTYLYFSSPSIFVGWWRYTAPMNDECYKYWNANEIEWWNLYAVMFLMRSKQIVVMFGFRFESLSYSTEYIYHPVKMMGWREKKQHIHKQKQELRAKTLIVKWKHINRFDFGFASEFFFLVIYSQVRITTRAIHKNPNNNEVTVLKIQFDFMSTGFLSCVVTAYVTLWLIVNNSVSTLFQKYF